MESLIIYIASILFAEGFDQFMYLSTIKKSFEKGYKILPEGLYYLKYPKYIHMVVKSIPLINIIYTFIKMFFYVTNFQETCLSHFREDNMLSKLSEEEQAIWNENPSMLKSLKMNKKFVKDLNNSKKFYQINRLGKISVAFFNDEQEKINILLKEGGFRYRPDEYIKELLENKTNKNSFTCNIEEFLFISTMYDIDSHMEIFDFSFNVVLDSNYSCLEDKNMLDNEEYQEKILDLYKNFIYSFRKENNNHLILDKLNNVYLELEHTKSNSNALPLINEIVNEKIRKRK